MAVEETELVEVIVELLLIDCVRVTVGGGVRVTETESVVDGDEVRDVEDVTS